MKTLVPVLLLFICSLSFAGTQSCSGARFSSGENAIRIYDPLKEVQRQVVILPPTGGENAADRRLAVALCRKGHLVKVVDYPQPPVTPEDFQGHERVTRQIITSIDGFFSGETLPTTIIGASLGGIYGSLLYSIALRGQSEWKNLVVIDSLVATVAGGPLPEILAYSDQKDLKVIRQARFDTGVFKNPEEYRLYLDQFIFTDVMKLLETNGKVLFYGSTNDKIVPTKTQKTLSQALGGKTRWIRGLGHPGTVAFVYFTRANEIHRFLQAL